MLVVLCGLGETANKIFSGLMPTMGGDKDNRRAWFPLLMTLQNELVTNPNPAGSRNSN